MPRPIPQGALVESHYVIELDGKKFNPDTSILAEKVEKAIALTEPSQLAAKLRGCNFKLIKIQAGKESVVRPQSGEWEAYWAVAYLAKIGALDEYQVVDKI